MPEFNFDKARSKPGALESSIKAKILAYLNSLPQTKMQIRHQSGFNKKGDPDITGCIQGRHAEIEIKKPKKRCTKLQARRLQEWIEVGAIAGRATSVDDVKAILRIYGVQT